jgi:hypothetical protein
MWDSHATDNLLRLSMTTVRVCLRVNCSPAIGR